MLVLVDILLLSILMPFKLLSTASLDLTKLELEVVVVAL